MNSRLARVGLLACVSYIDFAFGAPEQKTATLPDRIRILYEAPPGCPQKAALVAHVVERVTIAWIADDTELARQIHVTMEYVEESGRHVLRSVNADDCDQAVGGIALIIALAIESQAVRLGSISENAAARLTTTQAATLTLQPSHEKFRTNLASRPAVTLPASIAQPSIVYDHGNQCAPAILTTLENRIDEISNSAQWMKCDTADGVCAN